jgi:hypothetical protein
MCRMRALAPPAIRAEVIFECLRAADGVKAANCRSGDFGTSPFLGSSSDKPVLASVCYMAVPSAKHNRGEKLNAENLRAALGNRPAPHQLFIDPTLLFEGVCFGVQTEAASAPCPETTSRTASIAATAALAIIQAWPPRKLGSQSLGFDYLAPIDETMLQLNPIINGWYSKIRNRPIVIFHCIF